MKQHTASILLCLLLTISCCAECRVFHDTRTTPKPEKQKATPIYRNGATGCEEVHEVQIKLAVMGGKKVEDIASVPYMAAIGERSKNGVQWFCGGALVSKDIVVTAAHCILGKPNIVRLGGTSLLPNATGDDVAVQSFVVHEKYRSPQTYHDIALLRLVRPVQITKLIRPICLAGTDAGRVVGETTYVMGWGAKTVGGIGQDDLRKVDVQVFSNPRCHQVYSKSDAASTSFPRGIIEDQLCAGSPQGGKDACKGDSGGPLVIEDKNRGIRLLGVVSAGVGCGLKDVPGVYTRVSSYQSWINNHL